MVVYGVSTYSFPDFSDFYFGFRLSGGSGALEAADEWATVPLDIQLRRCFWRSDYCFSFTFGAATAAVAVYFYGYVLWSKPSAAASRTSLSSSGFSMAKLLTCACRTFWFCSATPRLLSKSEDKLLPHAKSKST